MGLGKERAIGGNLPVEEWVWTGQMAINVRNIFVAISKGDFLGNYDYMRI